ncbi:putative bifunctional diguanylate cyclase/phosphodiesterase [Humitalea sp. 24SJ18S-53]|uniref:putative bifunctional diguanylate cyclase/phosphodiesterase n=1 Tax=Humitalea sp. 24SJ18S-53 TaxID=3422307 RepID=UPI003D66F103
MAPQPPHFALGTSLVRLGPDTMPGPIRLATAALPADRFSQDRPPLDRVTGLPGRVAFLNRLPAALAAGPSALVVVKLDRLAAINDTLGHAVGDAMLRAAAIRLRDGVRKPDLVGTLGGAAFAVLIPDVATDAVAATLAGRLVEQLCRPYPTDGATAVTGATAGFALAPRDGTRPDELLRRAGLALESSGADLGFARAAGFAPGLEADAHERLSTEAALRRALPLGELDLHYQPQVATATGDIMGFEALLRWQRDGTLVPPAAFLPVAEASGLILPIGAWVLRQACRTAMGWPPRMSIAVNVAAQQFADGRLVESVQSALANSGLAPSRLELEITESALLRHCAETLDQLRALRAMGVRIAMDDFGTGFASLSQLHAFPFDRLKIDRSFVAEIERGGSAAAIVATIAELGARMGLETVGEGVETPAQWHWLRDHGCTAAQGYLFGRPGPADQIPALLLADQAA